MSFHEYYGCHWSTTCTSVVNSASVNNWGGLLSWALNLLVLHSSSPIFQAQLIRPFCNKDQASLVAYSLICHGSFVHCSSLLSFAPLITFCWLFAMYLQHGVFCSFPGQVTWVRSPLSLSVYRLSILLERFWTPMDKLKALETIDIANLIVSVVCAGWWWGGRTLLTQVLLMSVLSTFLACTSKTSFRWHIISLTQ